MRRVIELLPWRGHRTPSLFLFLVFAFWPPCLLIWCVYYSTTGTTPRSDFWNRVTVHFPPLSWLGILSQRPKAPNTGESSYIFNDTSIKGKKEVLEMIVFCVTRIRIELVINADIPCFCWVVIFYETKTICHVFSLRRDLLSSSSMVRHHLRAF